MPRGPTTKRGCDGRSATAAAIDYLGLDVSLPWIQDRAHSLGISPEDLREGVASVLDYLRRSRALHDPEHEIFTKYWRVG